MNAHAINSLIKSLSESDHVALRNYFHVADTIADLIGPHCEVVVHSFASLDNSVVKIANGHLTGRSVGSPITDLGLKVMRDYLESGDTTPSAYYTKTADGRQLKSSTTILLGENGRAIGMLCVNINLSAPFSEIVQTFIAPQQLRPSEATNETFSANVSDVIDQALALAVQDAEANPAVSQKTRNKEITRLLYERGIFEFKEATLLVAEHLGITRHAIYKYIREFKAHQKTGENQ
ncbi:helix-turn-helix transcriptional regulator [Polycladidibacter hongkongensis]|uniref:helix-turn-helix transcriptional regulator n=1 Tax=Polycladidibacter hongkongensis TaxID=1647556 RepID=UPI000837637F|nr:PAS domain-containing protein [Pseudovibrio hongkongensis]